MAARSMELWASSDITAGEGTASSLEVGSGRSHAARTATNATTKRWILRDMAPPWGSQTRCGSAGRRRRQGRNRISVTEDLRYAGGNEKRGSGSVQGGTLCRDMHEDDQDGAIVVLTSSCQSLERAPRTALAPKVGTTQGAAGRAKHDRLLFRTGEHTKHSSDALQLGRRVVTQHSGKRT